MDRELGSAPRVEVDGRLGRIIARSASDMKIKVEFDDGTVEWVEMELAQLVREQAATENPGELREIGS